MAFRFKRREPVSREIRRLGCERIENALNCLKDCGRAEAIHCARKEIKKVRAVLRLARPGMAKKEFRRMTKRLREAANHLAGPRDAYMRERTLRDLARHFKGEFTTEGLRDVHLELRDRFEKEMGRFEKEKTAKRVKKILGRVAKALERVEVSGNGWRAIGPGVKKVYSQGQRAYQTGVRDSLPANFHEWRKHAKDLWYHVILLQPVWPEQMDAMASELEALGEYLGYDHDLFVLQQAVEEQPPGDGHAPEFETLNRLIEQRQGELRAAAMELGGRFYSERPSKFCNRLAGYWQTWRGKEKRTTPHAA